MAAPDLETLLDFETNVENAAQIFLANDTGLTTSAINLTLDQDDLELPRIEVSFGLGEALDPPDPKTTGSADLEYRKYSGTLNVMVMTRATLDGSETSHRSYRAKVRKSLFLNALNFTTLQPLVAQVVSGAGNLTANGEWIRDGDKNAKPRYTVRGGATDTDSLFWSSIRWTIVIGGELKYFDGDSLDVATPDLVTNWTAFRDSPAPTVEAQTVLPYYDINYLRPTGTDYTIDGDIATSTLTFAVNVVIRNDAWPV